MNLEELKKRRDELRKELEAIEDKLNCVYNDEHKYYLIVPVIAAAFTYTEYIVYSNSKKELKDIRKRIEKDYIHPEDLTDVEWMVIDRDCESLDDERIEFEGIEIDRTKHIKGD